MGSKQERSCMKELRPCTHGKATSVATRISPDWRWASGARRGIYPLLARGPVRQPQTREHARDRWIDSPMLGIEALNGATFPRRPTGCGRSSAPFGGGSSGSRRPGAPRQRLYRSLSGSLALHDQRVFTWRPFGGGEALLGSLGSGRRRGRLRRRLRLSQLLCRALSLVLIRDGLQRESIHWSSWFGRMEAGLG